MQTPEQNDDAHSARAGGRPPTGTSGRRRTRARGHPLFSFFFRFCVYSESRPRSMSISAHFPHQGVNVTVTLLLCCMIIETKDKTRCGRRGI